MWAVPGQLVQAKYNQVHCKIRTKMRLSKKFNGNWIFYVIKIYSIIDIFVVQCCSTCLFVVFLFFLLVPICFLELNKKSGLNCCKRIIIYWWKSPKMFLSFMISIIKDLFSFWKKSIEGYFLSILNICIHMRLFEDLICFQSTFYSFWETLLWEWVMICHPSRTSA